MTKKQKWAFLICGLLLFLIGSAFSVHDAVETYTISWNSDDDIGFRYCGFELYLLNEPLVFAESSLVWYELLDFTFTFSQGCGLSLTVEVIVLSLWEHRKTRSRKTNAEEKTA